MTAAVITAWSTLSFSRMSLISSILLSEQGLRFRFRCRTCTRRRFQCR